MVFSSLPFLFVFLPVFLAAYYLTPARWRSAVIVAGSSAFYGWWRVDFLTLLYAIVLGSWLVALGIEKYRDRRMLWLGVGANLLALAYFKYWNFGVNSFFAVFYKTGAKPPPEMVDVILPIGISFFVFHAISYIVDVWRKDTPATRNLTDFAAFIMLFPHLIAGPVLRYKDLSFQFKNRKHSIDLFNEGAVRLMTGFAKKALIADTVAPLAQAAFGLDSPSLADAWLGTVAYTVQIYFDFSGYSDMAVGLALMMGFRFIENFNLPYLSRSIAEFWRRWHISLSTWLRDYLYTPLGGNRKGEASMYVNLLITMLLGGLWHGPNWTYVAWGAWHGILLMLERRIKYASRIYCLLAVMLGWVLFRAPDISYAMTFYKSMAGLGAIGISEQMAWQIRGIALTALVAGIAMVAIQPLFNRFRTPVELSRGSFAMRTALPLRLQILIFVVFLLALTRLTAMNYSPFLYFQF